MYNDPSGEIFFFAALVPILGKIGAGIVAGAIAGAIIGGSLYLGQAAITGNFSWGGFAKAFFGGALTGAVSGALGQVFSASGFWATVGNGTLAGAGGGGINAVLNGQNFLEGLTKGAVIGGALGAVSYTINYMAKYGGMKDEFKFYDNNISNDGTKLEYSNNTLKKMRSSNFSKEEIKRFKIGRDLIGSEKYSQTKDGFFQLGKSRAYAYTTRPKFFSGLSDIHYAEAAFASKELLFTTMVHETGHSYIMNAGNFFIKQYDKIKLFNSGYSSIIDNLGHAAIYDLENHLKSLNNFNFHGIGYNKDMIINAINNRVSGDNTQGFNILRNFLFPVFNRKYGVISPF